MPSGESRSRHIEAPKFLGFSEKSRHYAKPCKAGLFGGSKASQKAAAIPAVEDLTFSEVVPSSS